MPGLEILADNVKCSHGATSGQINEDEMFYLARARHSACRWRSSFWLAAF